MTDSSPRDDAWLADRFAEARPRLHSVAARVLGDQHLADDAVQEAWIRLSRTDVGDVDSLPAWLTTVVSRICLDMLRSRTSRREDAWPHDRPDPALDGAFDRSIPTPRTADPAVAAEDADAVGAALLLVLDTLSPAERLAFVLHDVFAVPFDDVARTLDTTPVAARQLASRARRRVRGEAAEEAPRPEDVARQREVVDAFLAAAREGEFERLVGLLHPDAVLRADRFAVDSAAARPEAPSLAPLVRGPRAVAEVFSGRARVARAALVDGHPAAVWAPGRTARSLFLFEFDADGRVTAVDIVFDPETVAGMDVELL